MSMNNSSDTVRNRTRDLPACSAVPQPTAPPRVPLHRVPPLILGCSSHILELNHCINSKLAIFGLCPTAFRERCEVAHRKVIFNFKICISDPKYQPIHYITLFCYIIWYCEPNPYFTTNNKPSILPRTKRKRWKLERTSSMSLRVCSPHRCAACDGQALRIATTGALYWSRVGGQPRGRVFITFQLKCELRQAIQNPPSLSLHVYQSAVVQWNI